MEIICLRIKSQPTHINSLRSFCRKQNMFSSFGIPLKQFSDQGRNFEFQCARRSCKILGIRKTRTRILYPQSDCMVKRFSETLKSQIQIFVNNTKMIGMKTRYVLRITERIFQEDDKLWLYNPARKKGRSPKTTGRGLTQL